MTETHEFQRARYDLSQYIFKLSASQPKVFKQGDVDTPARPSATVAGDDVLNAFLRKMPQYEQYRDALKSAVNANHSLDQERWRDEAADPPSQPR